MLIVRYRSKSAETDISTAFGFLDETRSQVVPLKTYLSAVNLNNLPANFETICKL